MAISTDPLARLAELDGVSEAVAEARVAVDALYRHRVMRRRAPEVSAEAALRGARASAALAGADLGLEELRRRTDYGADAESRVVGGALRAVAEVGPLQPVWGTAPAQALARLHLVAAGGADGLAGRDDSVGRPRRGSERAVAAPGEPEGPAPGADEAAARIDALAALLAAPSEAPTLVVAAVVHGELLAVRPFVAGNGVVARAAQRLALVHGGLDPKSVCPAEVGHVELGASTYVKAMAGYAGGTPDGVAGWIAYCGAAVRLGARESVAVCEALQRGIR